MATAVTIAPSPILQFFNNSGAPNVGGSILTQVGSINAATYQDSAGNVPLPNPIPLNSRGEVSNAAGISCQLFLATNSVYQFTVFDVNGNQLTQATYVAGADLTGTSGAGQIGYSPTLVYNAATVGARLNDELTTSGFASLQAAVTAAAGKKLTVTSSFTITSAVVPSSNTVIVLAAGVSVNTSTADISHFDCTGKSNVQIYGPGALVKTGVGTTAYFAGVKLDSAVNCLVYGVEMQGMQWAGVYMKNAVNCHAVQNYIHDHLGSVQDASAVTVHANSYACSVSLNRMLNTGWHGVLVQDADPTAGVVPVGTRVTFNDIDGTTAYGITCYELTADDSDTLIEGNRIRNVTGVNPSGSGGAGIYVQNSGGVRVVNNLVRNVCTATLNNTLTPAGIAANNINATVQPTVIANNIIKDVGITNAGALNGNAIVLSGINVSSSVASVVVNGNTISQAALVTPSYNGIYGNAASNITISVNRLNIPITGSATGIFSYANNIAITSIAITGNSITGGTASYIRTDQVGGFTVSGLSITGGTCRSGSAAVQGVRLISTDGYSITGLQVDAGAEALYVNTCTKGRIAASRFETSGATGVFTSGTCTETVLDKSNIIGATSVVNNGATGFSIECRTSAIPTVGTWAVSDRAIRLPQAVGSPKAWTCTVAGAPGTWISEGLL